MKQKIEDASGPWKESAKKQRGRFRGHGLYELIKTYQKNSFFSKYSLVCKESSNINGPTRNYVMITLPQRGHFKRHISIDAVFVKDATHLSPYHLTRTSDEPARIEHAYMMFEENASGGLDWVVNAVTAYNPTMPNDRILLSPHEERLIRDEALAEARPILQDIQRFKDQCMLELREELSGVETRLSEQWSAFYATTTTLTARIIGNLQDLIMQKKDILEKIHLFSNHVMKHHPSRNKSEQCPQAPFLDEMIKMLDDRSHDMQKTAKHSQDNTQDLNNTLITASPVMVTTKSKKTGRTQQTTISLMPPKDMRASLKTLLQEISSCQQFDLHLPNERLLILSEEYKKLKQSNDIAHLFKKCDQLLTKKTDFFMKNAENLIIDLESLIKEINEQEKVHKNAFAKMRNSNHETNPALLAQILPEDLAEPCSTLTPLIKLAWKSGPAILKLRLDETILLPEMQERKSAILRSDIVNITPWFQRSFTFWFRLMLLSGTLEALEMLSQIFPTRFNQMGTCTESKAAYDEFFRQIITLSYRHLNVLSEIDKNRLRQYILVADFLYENQANYKVFFEENANKLYASCVDVFGDTVNLNVGMLVITIKHSHFNVFNMFLRHGLSADAVQYSNGADKLNLEQYIPMMELSEEQKEQAYLSLGKLMPCSDQAFIPDDILTLVDVLTHQKQFPRFFDKPVSVPQEEKYTGSDELPASDHALPDDTSIKNQSTNKPSLLATLLSWFLEPSEPLSDSEPDSPQNDWWPTIDL